MKNNIYVLFNTLSRRFGDVFASPTDATASFAFSRTLPKDSSNYTKLYCVGSIDLTDGSLETETPREIDFASVVSSAVPISAIESELSITQSDLEKVSS